MLSDLREGMPAFFIVAERQRPIGPAYDALRSVKNYTDPCFIAIELDLNQELITDLVKKRDIQLLVSVAISVDYELGWLFRIV